MDTDADINFFGIFDSNKLDFAEARKENNIKLQKCEEYKRYIDDHITNVYKAWKDIYAKLSNAVMSGNSDYTDLYNAAKELYPTIFDHDATKYSDYEFEPYRVRFYPCNDEEQKLSDMDEDWEPYALAWQHHYKNNWHHPEHWVTPNEIRDMTLPAIVEMICDWESFKYLNKGSAVQYWTNNKDKKSSIMSPNTFNTVDFFISLLSK